MEKSPQPKQCRKPTQVRRREIVEAGMRILTSGGGRQFTADRLAAEVGITGGTVFRHFASMDEILDAIVDRIEELIFEGFPPRAEDPMEALRQFFEARVRVISGHPEVSELLLTNTLIPNAGVEHRRNRLQKFKRRSGRFVYDRFEEAAKRNLLVEGIRPEEGVILVLGSIYAIGHMGFKAGSVEEASDMARRTWRNLERALLNRK